MLNTDSIKNLLIIKILTPILNFIFIATTLSGCYTNNIMAAKPPASKKDKQLTLEEYAKIKEKLAKSKLKLTFPWIIKLCFIVPLIYFAFLIIYYLIYLRFLAEH